MESKPHCLIIMGMAGSGKSTFSQQLYTNLCYESKEIFSMNLDPAVKSVRFPVNLDIRSSIDFTALMKEHQLGPNGAILTSLNIYATRFHEALSIMNSQPNLDYILIDTPGQIEAFSWSASGMIISESLASEFPTTLIYILDSCRCQNPNSFMSNMLYATSIYFKMKLPMLLVFNKTDLAAPDMPLL